MSTPVVLPETETALNEGQRLVNVFVAPSKTMADLKRNASWWIPWLILSIVAIAFVYTVDKKIGWGQVIETQIQSNPKAMDRLDKQPAEQKAKIMHAQEVGARYVGYASPVTTLLLLVVVAGVLLAVFNFGFGAKLKFKEMMAVASYSYLVSIVGTLLTILVVFFVDPESFDIKFPLATSIGYFIPASMPFVRALMGAFDVFSIWTIFLMATGVAEFSKVKKGTAFTTLFVLFFLMKLAGAAAGSI